jgi:hypothetical protein
MKWSLAFLLVLTIWTSGRLVQATHPAPGSAIVADGRPAAEAAIDGPAGVAVDHSGHRVRRITPNGVISTVAGIGAPAKP